MNWARNAKDVAAAVPAIGAVALVAAAVATVVAVAVVANSASSYLTFGRIATGCREMESHVADFAECAGAWVDFRAPSRKRPFPPSSLFFLGKKISSCYLKDLKYF